MTDLVWTPVKIRLGQIKPWSLNPRMSSKAQAQRLIKSERDLGQIQTLAVSPMVDGFVDLYDGHQRCSAWLTVKEPSFEVLALQSNRPLTEDERRKVSVTLHTATGSWDWDALSSWSAADLHEWGMDKDLLKEWNNETNNLKEMLNAEQAESVDAEPQTDRAAELLEKWQVKTGDLWQIGEHRLICGDCTDAAVVGRVMGNDVAVLMVTDPPYGVDYDPEWRDGVDKKGLLGNLPTQAKGKVENDGTVDWSEAYKLFSGNVAYVWHADRHAKEVQISLEVSGYEIVSQIVWTKPQGVFSRGDYHWQHEPCWYAVRKGKTHNWQGSRTETTVWQIAGMSPFGKSRDGQDETTGHGTQKPTECMARPIRNNTTQNELVYDPFVGSGTTLVACQNLSRRGRAVEISPAYCAVTLQRMADAFPELEIKRLE